MNKYVNIDILKEKAEKAHFYDEAGFDSTESAVRVSDIDKIPIADVRENSHGHWIDVYVGVIFECSVCGDVCEIPNARIDEYYNFCPICGAKMDEEVK